MASNTLLTGTTAARRRPSLMWRTWAACRNPTNIIIGEAVDLSFLSFSKWSLLPTFGERLLTAGSQLNTDVGMIA